MRPRAVALTTVDTRSSIPDPVQRRRELCAVDCRIQFAEHFCHRVPQRRAVAARVVLPEAAPRGARAVVRASAGQEPRTRGQPERGAHRDPRQPPRGRLFCVRRLRPAPPRRVGGIPERHQDQALAALRHAVIRAVQDPAERVPEPRADHVLRDRDQRVTTAPSQPGDVFQHDGPGVCRDGHAHQLAVQVPARVGQPEAFTLGTERLARHAAADERRGVQRGPLADAGRYARPRRGAVDGRRDVGALHAEHGPPRAMQAQGQASSAGAQVDRAGCVDHQRTPWSAGCSSAAMRRGSEQIARIWSSIRFRASTCSAGVANT